MSAVFGDLKSFRASERSALEKFSSKRTSPDQVIDSELAKRLAQLSSSLGVQLGLLISRDGHVEQVVVGSKERLYLPDLGRFRLDRARLRRLRLVVAIPETDAKLVDMVGERELGRGSSRKEFRVRALPIPDDFLTDLEKLRLDALAILAVSGQGEISAVSFAALDPQLSRRQGERRQRPIAIHYLRSLADLNLNFIEFIRELEQKFTAVQEVGFETGKEKAVLVGVYTGPQRFALSSMEELRELARTAGLSIVDEVIQRRAKLDPKTVLGKGKIEELVLLCLNRGADLLVFDRELSPSQLRSITGLTELRVIDRSMLILDIFAQRATSSAGRLQVELAQLKYSLPRLTEKDSGLSRLTGGIGGRGPGETKLEISRRRARDRISDLEKRIDKLAAQRGISRNRRQERGVPVVAIVGYTNSGKSTLLNTLTKSEVLAESKLFATLDPSSRRMRFPNEKEVVFVDTVGFIRELPKELVNAFRATLEEVGEADVLLHLVDASNPEMKMQIDVVNETLASLGFSEKPKVLVLNKTDLLSDVEVRTLAHSLNAIPISAATRQGLLELLETLQNLLAHCFKGEDPGGFLTQPLQP